MNKRHLIIRLCLVAILLAAAYFGIVDLRFFLVIFPLALLVGFVIGFVVYALRLKKLLVAAQATAEQRSARGGEFGEMNQEELERLTREWEVLGFEQRGDFAMETSVSASFFRCLEHEDAGALAQLTCQLRPVKEHPIISSVTSVWGDESVRHQIEKQTAEIKLNPAIMAPLASPTSQSVTTSDSQFEHTALPVWMLMTHNHAPNRFLPLLRHPRVLGMRLKTGTSPLEIWQAHQERRLLVEAKLHKPLLRHQLLPLIKNAGQISRTHTVTRLKKVSIWKLMPYRFARDAKVAPIHDGELAPLDG